MKEVPQRSRLKPSGMKVPGLLIAALHNHSFPIAHTRVTRRAVDVVLLLPALQHFERHRKRHPIPFFSVDQAGIKIAVFMQLAARYRIVYLRAHRAAAGIETRSPLRKELRLILHVLTSTGQKTCPGKRPNRHELIELSHATPYSPIP